MYAQIDLYLINRHPEHSISTAGAISSVIKSRIIDKIEEINETIEQIKDRSEEQNHINWSLEMKIEEIKAECENRIRLYKDEFSK